jgi:hypothetical protein
MCLVLLISLLILIVRAKPAVIIRYWPRGPRISFSGTSNDYNLLLSPNHDYNYCPKMVTNYHQTEVSYINAILYESKHSFSKVLNKTNRMIKSIEHMNNIIHYHNIISSFHFIDFLYFQKVFLSMFSI